MPKRDTESLFKGLKASSEEFLRFATHPALAEWRAKRLKCSTIIDAGAGIGVQTIAFAKECKKVIAIEPDPARMEMCRKNLSGYKNVVFIQKGAIEALNEIDSADIVFLDPERPAEEKERDFEHSFSPSLQEFIKGYSKLTDKIAIELPPHAKNIPFEGEHEFVSIDGQLRRLTVYMGSLAKSKTSALLIPSMKHFSGQPTELPNKVSAKKYLYEVDEAIARAGLTSTVVKDCNLCTDEKGIILTSDKRIENVCFKNSFIVISECANNIREIHALLLEAGAGKTVLRMRIRPEEYWNERKKYEQGLSGEKTVQIFAVDGRAIICEKMK